MQNKQTILVLGCDPGAEQILLAALSKAGFRAKGVKYADIIRTDQSPACVLIHLDSVDSERALRFMAQPGLLRSRRVMIIDPHDPRARQFCADADIDDMIFKPIHLREMLTRLSFVLDREHTSLGREITLSDEHGFAQKLQTLADSAFSGVLVLEGRGREAKVYFEHGALVGVQFGKKTQKLAAGALWRLFPAAHRAVAGVTMPPSLALTPLELDVEQLNAHLIKTAAFFKEKFADISGISGIFRVNGAVYDQRYMSLPPQVRRIVQLFDGVRSLEMLFDVLELDEIILIQIVRRLLDENLIFECQSDEIQGVSLDDWILGIDGSTQKAPSKSAEFETVKPEPLQLKKDLGSVTKYLAELKALEAQLVDLPDDHEVTQNTKREITRRQATSEVCVHSRIRRDSSKQRQGFSEAELRDLLHEMPVPSQKTTEPLPFDRAFVERRMQKAGLAVITSRVQIHPNVYYSDAFLNQEAEEDEIRAANEEAELSLDISVDTSEMDYEDAEAELEIAMQWFKDEIRTRSGSFPASESEKTNASNADKDEQTKRVKRESAHASSTDEEKTEVKKKTRQSWAMEQYQRRHGRELSPEEWKKQTLARIHAEAEARDDKVKRILIVLIIIILLGIILVILFRLNEPTLSESQPERNDTPLELETPADTGETLPPIDKTAEIPPALDDMPDHPEALPIADMAAESAELIKPKPAMNPKPENAPSVALSNSAPSTATSEIHQSTSNTETPSVEAEQTAQTPSPQISRHALKAKQQAVRKSIASNDIDHAYALLRPLLKEFPDNVENLRLAGQVAAKRAEFDKAVEYFIRIESSYASKPAYWKQRASFHRGAGQIAQADAALDKAIAIVGADSAEGRDLVTKKSNPSL